MEMREAVFVNHFPAKIGFVLLRLRVCAKDGVGISHYSGGAEFALTGVENSLLVAAVAFARARIAINQKT